MKEKHENPQKSNDISSAPLEIMSGDALQQITKAEIDGQVATAHRFPRSMEKFKQRAFEMVTMDEDTAASCIYRRPVGRNKDGTQKFAEGLSVRTAEIVGASYGNLRVGAMLIEQGERQVKARGYAHDLEINFASTSEVVESTVDSEGNPYTERHRVTIGKVALAKARRDATFNVVPKALCKFLEVAAKKVIAGDVKTFETRRKAQLEWIESIKIDPKRVFAAIGVTGINDVGIDQLTLLTGLRTAITDGDITIEEAFPMNYMPAEAVKSAKEAAEKPEEAPKGYREGKAYAKMVEGFTGGSWREVVVHWGSKKMMFKGMTLDELATKKPNWFHFLRTVWEPSLYKGKYNVIDLALRCALDAAHAEHETAKENAASGPQADAPENTNQEYDAKGMAKADKEF